MRDGTALRNNAGEHVATIGFNEDCGLWQIVILSRTGMNFVVLQKTLHLQRGMMGSILKPGFPRSISTGPYAA